MDIGRVGQVGMQRNSGVSKKAAGDKGAKIDTNDYWVAGGQRFGKLNDIGDALRSGKLKMPKSGELGTAHKTFRPEEGKEMKETAKKFGLGALAGIGITMGIAAMGIASPIILLPMMGGMISGGIALGFQKAGDEFEKAPQIQERGTVTQNNNQIEFKDFDSQKNTVME